MSPTTEGGRRLYDAPSPGPALLSPLNIVLSGSMHGGIVAGGGQVQGKVRSEGEGHKKPDVL